MKFMRKSVVFFSNISLILLLTSCGRSLSGRETGVLTGGAIGSGLGAIVGHQVGNTGGAIAIGGAAGALTGGLIGNQSDVGADRATTQEERLRRQDEELYRQRREIREIRRQRGYDDQDYGTSDQYGREPVGDEFRDRADRYNDDAPTTRDSDYPEQRGGERYDNRY